MILFIIGFFTSNCLSNSPDTHSNANIEGGSCMLCSVDNPENSYDADINTYQSYELTAGTLGVYGTTTYDYAENIPVSTVITFTISFPDLVSGFFGDINGSIVFENTWIDFMDEFGNVVFTFNQFTESTVEILDGNQNLVAIKIINPYDNVRKIKFNSGSIVSVIGDVRVHEVSYGQKNFIFASRNLNYGYFDGTGFVSVDINHKVENPEHARFDSTSQNFDVNGQFTSFKYTLNANLSSEYLYAAYDWKGIDYSGLDNDLYLFLEDANLVALSDLKLLFDSGLIEVIVGYGDGSTESFSSGNSLIEAETLVLGSGRFFLKIDLNDAKFINNVEIRFQPFTSISSELKLYCIYLSPPSNYLPLPVEFINSNVYYDERTANIEWKVLIDSDLDYFFIEHLSTDMKSIETYKVNSCVNCQNPSTYQQEVNLQNEMSYYRISQVDLNGDIKMLDMGGIKGRDSRVEVFPNPSDGTFYLRGEGDSDVKYFLYTASGQLVQVIKPGIVKIKQKGVYHIQYRDENSTKTILILVY